MDYILNRRPVTNLGKVIMFELGRDRLTRKLVITAQDTHVEISVASPVGTQLANAKPGDRLEIAVKGEEGYLFGKVLSIVDSVAQAAA